MAWIDCIQGTDIWHDSRMGVLTASKFSRCITEKKQDISLAGIKNVSEELAGVKPPKDYTNSFMAYGTDNEPLARKTFECNGFRVAEVGFFREDYFGIPVGCSPDGILEYGEDYAGIEIKCPQPKQHKINIESDQIPLKYNAQIQYSMFVTGINKWFFYSWRHDMKPNYLIVSYDKEFESKIIEVINAVGKQVKSLKGEKK